MLRKSNAQRWVWEGLWHTALPRPSVMRKLGGGCGGEELSLEAPQKVFQICQPLLGGWRSTWFHLLLLCGSGGGLLLTGADSR